jgi:hypothetical protein
MMTFRAHLNSAGIPAHLKILKHIYKKTFPKKVIFSDSRGQDLISLEEYYSA